MPNGLLNCLGMTSEATGAYRDIILSQCVCVGGGERGEGYGAAKARGGFPFQRGSVLFPFLLMFVGLVRESLFVIARRLLF